MPLKNYYELLGIPPNAPQDEIKRAFRAQIARYHPDKVQHLGQEFQAMAADRAAELTEAYRILSDEGRRSEYDRARAGEASPAGAAAGSAASTAPSAPAATPSQPVESSSPAEERRAPEPERTPPGKQFSQERASRDTFVRQAAVSRFRTALEAIEKGYEEDTSASAFDLAFAPKAKMFGRGKGPRLLGRFVSTVDAASIADTWAEVTKWKGSKSDDVCAFVMGSAVAPPRDLARAIAEQRRKPSKGGKVVLVPVDARNWDANIPNDAPDIVKTILTRLRSGG